MEIESKATKTSETQGPWADLGTSCHKALSTYSTGLKLGANRVGPGPGSNPGRLGAKLSRKTFKNLHSVSVYFATGADISKIVLFLFVAPPREVQGRLRTLIFIWRSGGFGPILARIRGVVCYDFYVGPKRSYIRIEVMLG